MRNIFLHWGLAGALALGLCVGVGVAQQSQDKSDPPASGSAGKEKSTASAISRLTIEVTAGDDNKPVENASIYLKTLDQKLIKDKKFEVNVKTNLQGVAHVPDAPTGRVLIQVVASGWKTYGHWYDVADQQQTIKVHLERPPKWY
ncbi:MAG: hypothetical protein WCE52_18185 [Candidatus Acidiferrum sp.]